MKFTFGLELGMEYKDSFLVLGVGGFNMLNKQDL